MACARRDRPLVGRERELAVLLATVSDPDGHGVIVAGEAGVGKSHLLERATGDLAERGWTVLSARGDPTRSAPFGALGSLLAPLVPQEHGSPDLPPAAVLRRGLDHLAGHHAGREPLVVADDLHAFDAASTVLLQQAVLTGQVRLLGSYRTGETVADAVTALWKDDVVERLDLRSLSRSDCDDLVERLMDGPVAAQARARLWQWTEGNPLLVTEVVVHARGRGGWSRSSGLWHLDVASRRAASPVWSPSLAVIMRDRMAGAAPGVVDVVDALAVAGHLPVGVLEHLVGRRILAAAERSRLTRTRLDPSPAVVTLEHPLYGDLRRGQMDEERVTEIRARVLDVFERRGEVTAGDVPLLARWYVETGRTGPRAAELLTRGAELAWAANDLRTAAVLARRAREIRPDERSLRVLVNSLARIGETGDLHRLVDELLDSTADDALRAEAVTSYALVLFHHANRPDDAETVLSDAADATSDPRSRATLVKQAGLFRLQRGDLQGAETLVWPLMTGTDRARPAAAAVLAPVRLVQGRVAQTLVLARQHGRRRLTGGDLDATACVLGFAEVGALVEAGRLRDAEAMLADAAATYATDGATDPIAGAWLALVMGRISRLRGRPRTAGRWFREAADAFDATGRDGYAAWALAGLVEVQAQLGDRLGAAEAAADCQRCRRHPIGLAAGEIARGLAWAVVADDKVDEAADAIYAAARHSLLTGEVLDAAYGFHDLVRLGQAERAVDRLDDLAGRSDSLLAAAFAQHARATVTADVPDLEWTAERFQLLGCDLHAAEAWAQVAQICRSSGRDRRAGVAHRACVELRRSCEGARTPLLAAVTSAAALSEREQEIARLASSGLPRRAIADRLVISPRTVDSHLQRIYRKLGVADRRDLEVVMPTDRATKGGQALAQ